MGLFGSIGKVFGGALKVAGKVAGVASAIAPIPGLGAAGKLAGGLGGILGRAQKAQQQLRVIQSAASGGALKPGTIAAMSPVMPGGAVLVSGGAPVKIPGYGAIKPARKGKRRKRRITSSRRRRRRSSRRGLTAAQLRAGFGGKRRMRRR